MVSVKQHTAVLRDTSMFILVPPLYHYATDIMPRQGLSVVGFLLFIMSWRHWSAYDFHGYRRKLDIAFATTYIALEFITCKIDTAGVALRALSGLAFYKSCDYPVGSAVGLKYHLLFRYLGWVAVMRSFCPAPTLAAWTFFYVMFSMCSLHSH